MKKKNQIDFMSCVGKDIVGIKFKPNLTLKSTENKFYKIMRKYGIKKGTKSGNGVICNNFEWSMCRDMFLEQIKSYFLFSGFALDECPKDLRHY